MNDDSELIVVNQSYGLPYSKGLMAQALMATGISPERAYQVAAAVEVTLKRKGTPTITLAGLREVAREALGEVEGENLIERFRQWQRLTHLERPLIILIGGTTGVGKSTIATQIAHRLGITRVASTDIVRQAMRAFFSPDLMPAIHRSSFDAAAAVRIPVPKSTDLTQVGFIEQTKSVVVGVNALVQRAIEETQSMIVEGVHLVPGFLDSTQWGDALVLQYVIVVEDAAAHKSHFYVREWETDGIRPLRRYIEHFNQIRRIQRYIVARATQFGVQVVDNQSIDHTIKALMAEILQAVSAYPQTSVLRAGAQ
jgi:2-phosphoglycerate kinase